MLVFVAIYAQYSFSKDVLIQNFINKHYAVTLKIKEKFKNVLDKIEYVFENEKEENLKNLYMLPLLYDKDFNPEAVADSLNKDIKNGHYEVFLIDKNYTVVKGSYAPDIGFNLGAFKVYKKILDEVFKGTKEIDISEAHLDKSSMNLKKYYLIRSPDKKYLLQLAYVVDMFNILKKTYDKILKKAEDLKELEIFFVEKYFIYKIDFNNRYHKKESLIQLKKCSAHIFSSIFNKKISDVNLAEEVEKEFKNNKDHIIRLNLDKNILEIYVVIRGVFDNQKNRFIIKAVYDTTSLKSVIKALKERFLVVLISLFSIIAVMYAFIVVKVSREIEYIVFHMKKNEKIKKDSSFIEEIDTLKKKFNEFREALTEEINKNKILLTENKRFIVDTIHQIKTPLSIITLNLDYVKEKEKDSEIKEVLEEIEAAVTILSNSYEDLSYISGNGIVKYEAKGEINLSENLKERIRFFETVAKAHNKKILSYIEENIFFEINKIEFERIVDNNLSNAIKYSSKKDIFVTLKREDNFIVLKFESFGERIKDPVSIFEKDYREHIHKRGLGIGLNIVKNICDKYNIEYKVYYKEGKNVFEYKFKI